MRLGIRCSFARLQLGESVAVDGACLTVKSLMAEGFVADASEETLERTTLGGRRVGAKVNLERALAVGDRLGGHIVSGHVDGVGQGSRSSRRAAMRVAGRWTRRGVCFASWQRRGSVTVDGVSLTVNAVAPHLLRGDARAVHTSSDHVWWKARRRRGESRSGCARALRGAGARGSVGGRRRRNDGFAGSVWVHKAMKGVQNAR